MLFASAGPFTHTDFTRICVWEHGLPATRREVADLELVLDLVEQGRFLDADGRWRADIDLAALDVPEGVRLVIGLTFSYRLAQALGGLDSDGLLDALDEAERAGLIRAGDRDDEFLFSHELVRQALQAELSGPRRRHLHLRAATPSNDQPGEKSSP